MPHFGIVISAREMLFEGTDKSEYIRFGRIKYGLDGYSRYFHRPLSVLLNQCFEAGFSMDGIAEPVFGGNSGNRSRFEWIDIPAVLALRFRK